MPAPVVEIITFTASEALLADDSLVNSGMDFLKNTEGTISIFRGFQTEDASRAYIFILWETFEHFEKAIARESFPAFQRSFAPLVGGDFSLRHILFDVDATSAFSAPITEISTVAPKEGHTQGEIDALILELKESAHLVKGVHPSPPWGKVKQTSDYILAVGWDSLEAHQSAATVSPVNKVAEKLFEISELSVIHVALHKA